MINDFPKSVLEKEMNDNRKTKFKIRRSVETGEEKLKVWGTTGGEEREERHVLRIATPS
jgi:hypothetical protein